MKNKIAHLTLAAFVLTAASVGSAASLNFTSPEGSTLQETETFYNQARPMSLNDFPTIDQQGWNCEEGPVSAVPSGISVGSMAGAYFHVKTYLNGNVEKPVEFVRFVGKDEVSGVLADQYGSYYGARNYIETDAPSVILRGVAKPHGGSTEMSFREKDGAIIAKMTGHIYEIAGPTLTEYVYCSRH